MSIMPSRTIGARRAVIVVCAALCGGASLAVPPQPDQPAPRGVLELRGGGFVTGELVPAPEATGGRETLLWQSPVFTAPFEFRLADVTGVRCGTRPDAAPVPAESFRLRLRDGDVVAGVIEAIDADTITIDAAGGAGRQSLRIRRDEVESISRPAEAGSSFEGPGGLAGWTQRPADTWREEVGRLLSSQRGASVSRDLAAPARARYDIAVSWVDAAEFRLSLTSTGGGDDDGFWLELLRPVAGEPTLAVVRRQTGRALLEPIPMDRDIESVRLSLFVDQSQGRMAVVLPTAADRPVVDITLARGDKPEPLPGVRLAVTSGGICLESLRVTPWIAAEPTLEEGEGTTIAVRAGAARRCDLEGFDAQAKAFVRRDRAGAAAAGAGDRRRRSCGVGLAPEDRCGRRVDSAGGRYGAHWHVVRPAGGNAVADASGDGRRGGGQGRAPAGSRHRDARGDDAGQRPRGLAARRQRRGGPVRRDHGAVLRSARLRRTAGRERAGGRGRNRRHGGTGRR